MNKWIAIALFVAGCKQGLGDNCQTNNDCTEGTCSATKHICVAIGTSTDDEIDAPVQPPSITSFRFLAAVNAAIATDVVATITGTAIRASVPAGTNVRALKASFETLNGAAVVVGTASQLTGAVANDFTGPVVYTVIAEDGSMQNFTVTVTAP